MLRSRRDNLRNFVCFIFGVLIIYGPPSAAQATIDAAQLDFNFWFRAVLSGLLAVLIYMARGTESRLKHAEEQLITIDKIIVKRGETLAHHEGRLDIVENEQKQQMSMILLLKELILTNYHDKEETEKHRARVEAELRAMNQRLDHLARPFHRRNDDEGHHNDERA